MTTHETNYETLYSPTEIGSVRLRNRIMSSGHQTTLVSDSLPKDEFFAYHRARAEGGVGLIVLEAHGVSTGSLLTDYTLDASSDDIVDAYRPFADNLHEVGARVFVQLLHSGREVYDGEYAPPPASASDVPTDRLHAIPRPLETDEVYDLIDDFAAAAERLERAGVDGVELGGSHGYLLAQFWNDRLNDRTDEFGGDLESRCRLTTEIVERTRERVSDDFVVGMRISAEERHRRGLDREETLAVIEHVDGVAPLEYWSVVVGSSSTHRSCNYIVPPATEGPDVVRTPAEVIGDITDGSLIVTSRINTPERAEVTLRGGADVVGMTRALIADPDLPRKIAASERDLVTPCVACNQGCIGRYQEGLPIRCTVNPETGRELEYRFQNGERSDGQDVRRVEGVSDPRDVLIVGGGPAGLVAGATAAELGHDVTLLEREADLGGRVRTYASLDHRGRFEDWIETLERRIRRAGATIETNTAFDPADLDAYDPDAVVLATGASGRVPDVPIHEEATVLTATETLSAPERVAGDVLVSDWNGNWASLDVATVVADRVDSLEIVTAAYSAGEDVQQYVQNDFLGQLYEAGVTFTPHHRVASVGPSAVELENLFTESSTARRGVDTVIFSHVGEATYGLYRELREADVDLHRVGDCVAPRSLDEATWEGYRTAVEL